MYRVGQDSATCFDADGQAYAVLPPGTVVVEGRIETPTSQASQYVAQRKRRKGYADKRISPPEDKR